VVAAQIEAITSAKKNNLAKFPFPGETVLIRLIPETGYFITMNPGYAGRQELPENLKVLFRSVSMMVPDRQVIIKVKLASVGYKTFDELSIKFNILYRLCEEQLSKQRHYDFGLRNILSVLRTAGNIKRVESPDTSEEMLMCRTLRDMNLSKLVAQDKSLFQQLLDDIFPLQKGKLKDNKYTDVEKGIRHWMQQLRLKETPDFFIKVIQLYETSVVRHGFMLVGSAGSGKTTIAQLLTKGLTYNNNPHKIVRMNPKALTGQEMFGVVNPITGDWTPGVFSELWKKYNSKSIKGNTWLTCDGPIDAIWIENLNTVLDDNKILTLANGDRTAMTDNTKMVFEVENLNNASPATVSRCGIVFVSIQDLSWEPLIYTWIMDRQEAKIQCNPEEGKWMEELVQKYIQGPNLFLKLIKEFTYVMYTPPVIRINQMLNLMEALLRSYTGSTE